MSKIEEKPEVLRYKNYQFFRSRPQRLTRNPQLDHARFLERRKDARLLSALHDRYPQRFCRACALRLPA